jgi:hypothetical protein
MSYSVLRYLNNELKLELKLFFVLYISGTCYALFLLFLFIVIVQNIVIYIILVGRY